MIRVVAARRGARLPSNTLGCFLFGAGPATSDLREVPVAMRPLAASPDCELWLGGDEVQLGQQDGFSFAHDGTAMFASIVLPANRTRDLERATRSAYVHLDALVRRLGYPHWLRVWNFVANITGGDGDEERYRQFNAGRYSAVALKYDFETSLPAASGVGSTGGDLVIACLAGKLPATPIENPRQVSAFRYPRQYGPRAPLFSRAALLPDQHLLVSGTASIVGHESLHPGDTHLQLEETARNLHMLLAETGRKYAAGDAFGALRPESLRVYVRNADDASSIRAALIELLGEPQSLVLIEAEICRRELLLEIEGTYRLERPGS
jgi:chorismate lyase / 3-hydroxybenzoate synthase